MMPNVVRGSNAAGLVYYLFGPGRANEHSDPHIIAAADVMAFMYGYVPGRRLIPEEARLAGADLEETQKNYGVHIMRQKRVFDAEQNKWIKFPYQTGAHVWHCSLSLHPDEPALTDDTWHDIVQEFMTSMGFNGDEKHPECRWLAVRHGVSKNGGDHVHIAAVTVHEDGTRWNDSFDFARTQKTCTKLEKKYGLVVVPSREKEIGSIGEEPWERVEAEQLFEAEHGKPFEYPEDAYSGREEAVTASTPLSVRGRLEAAMRAASGCSETEREYVEALGDLGVYVRPRYAKNDSGNVIGYSVGWALDDGSIRWMSPSKIARDLSLPRLRKEVFRDSEKARQSALEKWANGMSVRTWNDPEMDMSMSTDPNHYSGSSMQEHYLQQIQENAEGVRGVLAREHSEEDFAWATRVISEQYAVASFFVGKDGWKLAQTSRMIARLGAYKTSPYTQRRPSPTPFQNRSVLFGKRSLRRAYAYPQALNALAFTVETLMDLRADARATKRYLRECDMAIATLERAQQDDHYAYWDSVFDNHPLMSEHQKEIAKGRVRGINPEYEYYGERESSDEPSYTSPSFKPPTFGDDFSYGRGKGL